ncbi:hypothetical protein A3Q56_03934, partial [Intoshia linei]
MNNIFNNEVIKKDKGLTACYEISKIIAKAYKPHTLGETSATCENQKKLLQENLKQFETFKKLHSKSNVNFYKLMSITADLIDQLEKAILGEEIGIDVLPRILDQLFGVNTQNSIEFSRPGTASKILRNVAST